MERDFDFKDIKKFELLVAYMCIANLALHEALFLVKAQLKNGCHNVVDNNLDECEWKKPSIKMNFVQTLFLQVISEMMVL